MIVDGWLPNRGHCFIHLDKLPDKIGSLHVPESARDLQITNVAHSGMVLAVTPSREEEELGILPEFKPWEKVWLLLHDEDRDGEVIITKNEVVMAVVENGELAWLEPSNQG